jgi:hypothetical protein
MSEQVDHDAAKNRAQEYIDFDKRMPMKNEDINLARALLDLDAKLTAERKRVDRLAELVKEAYRAGCSDAANYEQGNGQGHQGKDVLDDLATIMEDRDNG